MLLVIRHNSTKRQATNSTRRHRTTPVCATRCSNLIDSLAPVGYCIKHEIASKISESSQYCAKYTTTHPLTRSFASTNQKCTWFDPSKPKIHRSCRYEVTTRHMPPTTQTTHNVKIKARGYTASSRGERVPPSAHPVGCAYIKTRGHVFTKEAAHAMLPVRVKICTHNSRRVYTYLLHREPHFGGRDLPVQFGFHATHNSTK